MNLKEWHPLLLANKNKNLTGEIEDESIYPTVLQHQEPHHAAPGEECWAIKTKWKEKSSCQMDVINKETDI